VGEIRDRETADIAFRGSQTGHLVLSTLHTNNSVATLTRLYDMGLEPYLISSAIQAIVAQRLVRLICPHCEEEYKPNNELLMKFKSFIDHTPSMKFIHGRGCAKCSFTGYFGRTALFEILEITLEIRQLISEHATEMRIFEKARSEGLGTLAESGFRKVTEGVTTLEELSNIIDLVDEHPTTEPEKTNLKRKTTILVVDDSKLIREMVISALSNDDFEFKEAEDGEQGLKLMHTLKPDLLISDVNMPKMDGFELVHRVRSSLETATIPIIMLTTLNDKESELKGIRAGADDYIAKPFDAEKLRARTGMILRRIKRNV
jgi:CheY-like chemotaxis protein